MDIFNLRHILRQQRCQLSESERAAYSKQLTARLQQQDFYQHSQHIACYWPFDGEIDTRYLIEDLWQLGKVCYLPILNHSAKTLNFALYTANSLLRANRYGILEPVASTVIDIVDLDIIAMPLVAFDASGNRIGTGGGYYDRSLQGLKQTMQPAKPLLIGLAYEFQRQEKITPQSWDIQLDSIITEQNIYFCSERINALRLS